MRKTAGFTLIELVIVIVILGILGAVAAPKFLNLQGDAYGANLDGLKNSLESAATLGNTKAILAGEDKSGNTDVTIENVKVAFTNGYPAANTTVETSGANNAGILGLINFDDSEYVFELNASSALAISPSARATGPSSDKHNADCAVIYNPAQAGERPAISVNKDKC